MNFYDNDVISDIWTSPNGKIVIRKIDEFVDNIPNVVSRFITLNTFSYTNTLYGKLANDLYDKKSKVEKIEILAILEKYEKEIDKTILKKFKSLTDDELKKYYLFEDSEINCQSREQLYSQVKGGQYCEMLLSYIACKLGYEKIISKLYFEFGDLSPTGIDVPYINISQKKILLGECKIYKNVKKAISSVYTDINNIYNGNKLEKEILEWKSKITSMPEEVQDIIIDNQINSKAGLLNYVNEINIVGFVVGNKIDDLDLKSFIDSFKDFPSMNKMGVLLIAVPIESKDFFIECCHKVISNLKQKVEADYE